MKYSRVLVIYPTWKGITYSSLRSQQQHRTTTIT